MQYGLQKGDHELGSKREADFTKAETGDKISTLRASNRVQGTKVRLSEMTKATEQAEALSLYLKN